MSVRLDFYQEHLNRVSRSFAFCIERLQSPLREQVSLSYLVCRILDSVEDADWADPARQSRHFETFDRFLTAPFEDDEITAWAHEFPPGLPEGERLLLPVSGTILRDIQALEPDVRDAIVEPVLSMSRGMRYFAERRRGGPLRLSSLTEVNQYCFFVAGVVGEVLTRLTALARGTSELDQKSLADAFHFGLFLQKVNLLKDQAQDESSGRFLVPSRAEVRASMREHARRAIDYVTGVPDRLLSYRLFCSWSLFLGLASLPFIEMAWRERQPIKISRSETQTLLGEVEAVVADEGRLREMFESFLPALEDEGSGPELRKPASLEASLSKPLRFDEIRLLYRGHLDSAERRIFGMA